MDTATSKHMSPSKKRYDEKHPTVSVRTSNATRKKLEKYKKEGMTWSDMVEEGLRCKEEGIDKENVIGTIQKIMDEKVKDATKEILEETKKMAIDTFAKELKEDIKIVRKQNEENEKEMMDKMTLFLGRQGAVRFNIRTIKEYMAMCFPNNWKTFFEYKRKAESRDEDGELDFSVD